MLADKFSTAFMATAGYLALLLGFVAALLVLAVAVVVLVVAFSTLFDLITDAISRRMNRKHKQPKTRIGRIIQRSTDGV